MVNHTEAKTPVASTERILVNLLPPEMLFEQKQGRRWVLINRLSITLLTLLVFFTSATLALQVSQNGRLQEAQQTLAYTEETASSLKGKEEQLLQLKERLKTIQTLSSGDGKRKAIFNLVVFNTPPEISISEVTVDKNGNMSLQLSSVSLTAIENFFDNLSSKETNSDLVTKIDLDGLSYNKDNTYRLSLKITSK